MSKTIPVRLEVLRATDIGPSMRRVILGGAGFTEFWRRIQDLPGYTDTYVKLLFWPDDFTPDEPVDLSQLPDGIRPTMRTYTIRHVDPGAREVVVDFVVHGDEGFAGPWAMQAKPGDQIHVRGPNGGYAPDPDADWYLFVGDEAGLPAITASIESLSAKALGVAFIEIDGPDDELPIEAPDGLEVHWLRRDGASRGTTTLLDDAVRAWDWLPGRAQVFVHGESGLLKSVRPYVLGDRAVERSDASISAYWRRGETEEGFRVWKSQQTEAVMRPGDSGG